MRIEIMSNYGPSGYVDYFDWHYWGGPDGIDEHSGTCFTLGECFEHILVARTRLEQEYKEAFNE
jgi:hypothetical protein